jgi:alpha-glucosidase
MKKIFGLLSLFILLSNMLQSKPIEVLSPDGQIKVSIYLGDKINYDKIYYSVSCGSNELFHNCHLQMRLKNQILGENPKLAKQETGYVSEVLTAIVPLKFSTVKNEYNRLKLTFKDNYSIEFRVFNDGFAYRFITNFKNEIEVMDEDFSISFHADYLVHLQQTEGFRTSCEEPYTHIRSWDFVNEKRNMTYLPLLIDTKTDCKILISESALIDYPGMFLIGTEGNGMKAVFPHVPLAFSPEGDRSLKIVKEADYIAKTQGMRSFPWRYFIISKNDAQIVENTMNMRLAGKCEIADPSWIKPGQASWEWWNAASPYGQDVNFVAGFNLDTYKYFIDFASKYGVKYIVMDEGWAKSTRDPYTPNPVVDVHELIRYGNTKNVGIFLWLTWLTVENNFELFKIFEEWGVKGVKIDFMDRQDQWMVDFYERVAREAAKHHLLVDFHGAFKPSGLEYRYPNVLSYEGVRGMEQMDNCIPDNSLYLPFIRNAVGAMDYTPGAMISMQPAFYGGHSANRPNSASIGTRAYQMALFVVFESGLQMLADNPTLYYRNHECTEFITSVPTVWDETKVLNAKVGEYLVLAKRKGDKWFIGAITNSKEAERIFELDLSFLPKDKTMKMTSFEDGINAGRQAMDYRRKEKNVKSDDKINIRLVHNGGYVAVIE